VIRRPRFAACLVPVAAAAAVAAHASAAEIDFERHVRPLLVRRCGECHGPDSQESSLRLDVRHRAMKGGDFGSVIRAGNAADSELVNRITTDDVKKQMPPDGERLSPAEVELLRRWIDAGAIWPETDVDRLARESDRDPRLDHWAWQQIGRPVVPPPHAGWTTRNEIDRFVQAKLSAHALAPAPEADRRTLIRRLSFDLLGLPPTPEAVAEYIADTAPDAYEKLIDRLLSSPQYGERWARHWLDIAHYADTHGFERDQLRPNAWRYRDWVIRSLNADLPYDEFLRRQIAGDVLAPDDPESVTAAGFVVAGPWDFVGQVETRSDVLRRQARADDLDDMVTQVMTAACGVTINCARCHDHKLDPVSQQDYYALVAVFAGVKRADTAVSRGEQMRYASRKREIEAAIAATRREVQSLAGRPIDLADIVGGGDGRGGGTKQAGIDPRTGKPVDKKPGGFLANIKVNTPQAGPTKFVNAVFVPDGPGDVPITTTGLVVNGLPATSRAGWDAIRHGPVASQYSTKLGDVDFNAGEHTLLGLHANAGISFDLTAIHAAYPLVAPRFRAEVGYGGTTPTAGADYFVFVDGSLAAQGRIGRNDGGTSLDLPLPSSARFLTLIATDAGNGISMDQVFFGDPRITGEPPRLDDGQKATLRKAEEKLAALGRELTSLAAPAKVYGPVPESPQPVRVHIRGNPETPGDEVTPGSLPLVAALEPRFGDASLPDAARRMALARWITDPANPLPARVIVNRLWHHHFGTGIVDTPSDVGIGGGRPSHPELLDWLAVEFVARGWSLKAMHRLICSSHAYRQRSVAVPDGAVAAAADADDRLLWRQNMRRLDAESLRDATLAVSGCLNTEMFGPGYRDFDYQEAYAPIYRYVTPDTPELWRRSIYRFVVRSTPHAFMTTLDCPNPANLTPARLETTTALQSLALLNNDFMLRQAGHWAKRLEREAGADPAAQVRRAYAVAFARQPDAAELAAAVTLVQRASLPQFCRMLFNTNEFVYVD